MGPLAKTVAKAVAFAVVALYIFVMFFGFMLA
jgi:hypothetical protein